ncbi:hypothetical protein V8C44DRAFT_198810 [Trichoderma aethiopicum]
MVDNHIVFALKYPQQLQHFISYSGLKLVFDDAGARVNSAHTNLLPLGRIKLGKVVKLLSYRRRIMTSPPSMLKRGRVTRDVCHVAHIIRHRLKPRGKGKQENVSQHYELIINDAQKRLRARRAETDNEENSKTTANAWLDCDWGNMCLS